MEFQGQPSVFLWNLRNVLENLGWFWNFDIQTHLINLSQANFHISYPLKASQNLLQFDIFMRNRKGKIGLKWLNLLTTNVPII